MDSPAATDARDVCRHLASLSNSDRRTILFLHSISGNPGALEAVCSEVIKMAPERLLTSTMAKFGEPPGGVYGNANAGKILEELREHPERMPEDDVYFEDRDFAPIPANQRTWARMKTLCSEKAGCLLKRSIVDGLKQGFISDPECFQDLSGALAAYVARQGAEESARFYKTNIGKAVWETLEWCIAERRPVCVIGREGRGKSEAARACFRAHRGEAVIFTVPGNGTKDAIFRELAGAVGLPNRNAKTALKLAWLTADFLRRSGLALFIDEAHFLLMRRGQGGRPEMLDWLDSVLVDHGVPVALISTPQFFKDLGSMERRTGWNAGQFLRRFAGRCTELPEQTARVDLLAISARELPLAGERLQAQSVDYASRIGRDVSGLGDLIKESRIFAREAGRSEASPKDVQSAVLVRARNDTALDRLRQTMAGGRPMVGDSLSDFGPAEDGREVVSQPPPRSPSAEPVQGRCGVPAEQFPGGGRLTATLGTIDPAAVSFS
jgi:hypothetical protein